MDLNEYQELAGRTIPTAEDKRMRVAEFCVALNEEAGEASGVLKKIIFHDHPFDKEREEKLVGELGDTLWHIAAIASEFNISLEYIANYNIKKLQRRYPEGFSKKASLRRADVNGEGARNEHQTNEKI